MYWASRMSILICRSYEPSNRSTVPSWLRDPEITLLPCGLDNVVKGVRSPKSVVLFGLGNPVVSGPQTNHGSQWIANDVNVENREAIVNVEL